MLLRRLMYTICFLLLLQDGSVQAGDAMTPEEAAIYQKMLKSTGMDAEAMQGVEHAVNAANTTRPWADAKSIHYHIVGVYKGDPLIVSDGGKGSGYAHVTDRVEIGLDWQLAESQLVGTPSIQNTKSVVTNPHNPEPSCSPPVLKGEYEHYELLGIKQGLAGTLELNVRTSYPAVEVADLCKSGWKTIPAARNERSEEMVVPSPTMLDMALPDSDNLRVTPDKSAMIVKKNGWTWTFTPSIKGG